jgi:hypothetical protein
MGHIIRCPRSALQGCLAAAQRMSASLNLLIEKTPRQIHIFRGIFAAADAIARRKVQ